MFEFIGNVFNALIAQPILNLLIIIIALLPGHNLGIAIIIFTILVRLALYPLLKKQLHHTMAMRKLQPEIKRIKKKANGDRQKEYALMMELYKEREIKPMASIGILLAQLPILLALFFAINKIVKDQNALVTNAYSWVANLPFIQDLINNTESLQTMFLGFIDLLRPAVEGSTIYWPAMILVLASVAAQYFQSRQLIMTNSSSSRSLRQILKDSSSGKQVDQSEIQAATSKFTLYIIPFMLFIFAINLASAISLYWLVGGIVAIIQQTRILRSDVEEMEASVESIDTTVDDEPVKAELIKTDKKTGVKTYIKQDTAAKTTKTKTTKSPKKASKKKSKKRR